GPGRGPRTPVAVEGPATRVLVVLGDAVVDALSHSRDRAAALGGGGGGSDGHTGDDESSDDESRADLATEHDFSFRDLDVGATGGVRPRSHATNYPDPSDPDTGVRRGRLSPCPSPPGAPGLWVHA